MADEYKIREVRIEVQPGVVLVADVSSVAGLRKLLKDLGREQLSDREIAKPKLKPQVFRAASENLADEPMSRIAMRADIPADKLEACSVLAIKDGVPQLLRPNAFTAVTDATLVLLYSMEVGLKINPIEFDSFKAVYQAQNIKSGSALPMLLTNLRMVGYLDKALYGSQRQLRLTAKGEKRAIEVLKAQCKLG